MARTVLRAPALLGVLLIGGALLPACGCSGSSRSPTAPTPSQPQLDLTATWSGTASDDPGPGTTTWRLTQSGTSVSGTFAARDTNTGIVFNGTVSGTLSGTTLSFTMSVPAGGIQSPLFASCTVNVSGSASVTTTTIIGTYAGINSCTGPVTNGRLALTRQ